MNDKDRIVQWIEGVLQQASKLGGDKGIEMMHQCGANCAKSQPLLEGAIKVQDQLGPNAEPGELLDAFKKQYYDKPGLWREGNKIFLVFPECTCPMAKEGVTNPFLCNCTLGYSKNNFEALFGRPVEVKLLKSVLKGDACCKQEITVPDVNP
ncbi:MAG: hypothetical protein GY765_30500 [bacterium]|nr:hypothetical protein [bacterium]